MSSSPDSTHPEQAGQVFQVGDLVHFGHDDVSVYTVSRTVLGTGGPMVELKELPGQFAQHLFKRAQVEKN